MSFVARVALCRKCDVLLVTAIAFLLLNASGARYVFVAADDDDEEHSAGLAAIRAACGRFVLCAHKGFERRALCRMRERKRERESFVEQ